MHHHHDAEEQEYFPSIELISGVQGLMERSIEQHRAYKPEFDEFQVYSKTFKLSDYDGQKIRDLIETFAEPLSRHLNEEIDTLRALDVYDSGRIRQAYRRLEKMLVDTDNYRIAPLVFGTADRGFEGGIMTSQQYHFLYPTLFTTCLLGGIMVLGDLTRVRCGGTVGNWLCKMQTQRLDVLPSTCKPLQEGTATCTSSWSPRGTLSSAVAR
ncbi:hypothetical protein K431DRAFT_287448 [Polychaeton citri CBS 116435]|uniref:Hemerythrin-like domain-containing protein n=1 Tax=Polychaeton citri CBS 116435 TaxID=1314669 RepID=A0A9P4Q178_9PEZI|nr:hypothetical protein K431DRAFT_287448 [Polychaeton citri CBS 116435]